MTGGLENLAQLERHLKGGLNLRYRSQEGLKNLAHKRHTIEALHGKPCIAIEAHDRRA